VKEGLFEWIGTKVGAMRVPIVVRVLKVVELLSVVAARHFGRADVCEAAADNVRSVPRLDTNGGNTCIGGIVVEANAANDCFADADVGSKLN